MDLAGCFDVSLAGTQKLYPGIFLLMMWRHTLSDHVALLSLPSLLLDDVLFYLSLPPFFSLPLLALLILSFLIAHVDEFDIL